VRRALSTTLKAIVAVGLALVLGVFGTHWVVRQKNLLPVPQEVVDALRSAADICMENPIERLFIQKIIVKEVEKTDGEVILRNERLGVPSSGQASISPLPFEDQHGTSYEGVAVGYTIFAVPLIEIFAVVDSRGTRACRRSHLRF
jgi:hypothetical protein